MSEICFLFRIKIIHSEIKLELFFLLILSCSSSNELRTAYIVTHTFSFNIHNHVRQVRLIRVTGTSESPLRASWLRKELNLGLHCKFNTLHFITIHTSSQYQNTHMPRTVIQFCHLLKLTVDRANIIERTLFESYFYF